MTDPKIITVELQALSGALSVALKGMTTVQNQMPPGPPVEPTQIAALNAITASAQSIQQIAGTILKVGGNSQ